MRGVPRETSRTAVADDDMLPHKVAQNYALWRGEVFERAWAAICEHSMGWSRDDTTVRLVREGICLYEDSPDNVREALWQQVGVGEAIRNRVDRLRMMGNGVVPLAAAVAYRTLRDRLT